MISKAFSLFCSCIATEKSHPSLISSGDRSFIELGFRPSSLILSPIAQFFQPSDKSDVFVQVSYVQVGANVSIQIFEEFVLFFASKNHEP